MKRSEIIALLRARNIDFKPDATDAELRALVEQAQKREGADLQMRAMFDPQTINAANRTVDVTFATENPVQMMTWDGPIMEILSLTPDHIRMERINGGAPLLNNHSRYEGVHGVLGIVERAWLEGTTGRATIRFSKRQGVEDVWNDVVDGILKGISVGYRVFAYEKTERQGTIPEFRAIDWEPYEISLAPVQADHMSVIRNMDSLNQINQTKQNSNANYIMKREQIIAMLTRHGITFDQNATDDELATVLERALEKKPAPPTPEPIIPAAKISENTETREAVIATERKRSTDITEAVRKAGLPESFALELISGDKSIDQARAAIIDKFAEGDPNKGQRSNPKITADETDKRREAMTDALLLRAVPELNKEHKIVSAERAGTAREFRGHTLMDLARMSLERIGVDTRGMSKLELVGRAITSSSSDFPVLLEGTNRRVLLAAYEAVPDLWRRFCAIGSVSDFREYKRVRTGSFSRLDLVPENAEYKNKNIPDGEFESVAIETFGNTINVSRQMIINDDLSAFTRLAQMLGRAAARSIEIDVFAMFAENAGAGPTMQDGNPLFHTSHANIATTAAAPTVASFDASRQLMGIQKDPSGNDFIGLTPAIWLGPLSIGGAARVTNGSQYDPDATNKLQRPNIVNGLVREIIDSPRLSGNAWYFLADPSQEPVFEVNFLDGQQSPFLESEEEFTVDGMKWKVRHDYGVDAIGYRGITKNAGVNP